MHLIAQLSAILIKLKSETFKGRLFLNLHIHLPGPRCQCDVLDVFCAIYHGTNSFPETSPTHPSIDVLLLVVVCVLEEAV